jgi:diaminopimelate decarboxylase
MTQSIPGLTIAPALLAQIAQQQGTPCYVYDEAVILQKCRDIVGMPNAFGLRPRFAIKANSNRALLQLIAATGINIDASSLNEARRARMAGIPSCRIMLTTQEVPLGHDRHDLESMMLEGMRYNVCSLRQLRLIAPFAAANGIRLCFRIHPGVGSGESATRNTGDDYSCFGIHLTNVDEALRIAREAGVIFDELHAHIGSGGDPAKWQENIDRELGFVEKWFPDATKVSFGGGFRVARMPDEKAADIAALGNYAKSRLEDFAKRTGRKLEIEVEPGTYIMANAGYLVTRVIDLKSTGPKGFEFIVIDGGMEVNTRPLLYGSRHPFHVIAKDGTVLSSEFDLKNAKGDLDDRIVVGRCCESGDSQTLDAGGQITTRVMAHPQHDDFVVIGGTGAYCSSMSPFNYNSHVQISEILVRTDGKPKVIRHRQTLDQVVQNEVGL